MNVIRLSNKALITFITSFFNQVYKLSYECDIFIINRSILSFENCYVTTYKFIAQKSKDRYCNEKWYLVWGKGLFAVCNEMRFWDYHLKAVLWQFLKSDDAI